MISTLDSRWVYLKTAYNIYRDLPHLPARDHDVLFYIHSDLKCMHEGHKLTTCIYIIYTFTVHFVWIFRNAWCIFALAFDKSKLRSHPYLPIPKEIYTWQIEIEVSQTSFYVQSFSSLFHHVHAIVAGVHAASCNHSISVSTISTETLKHPKFHFVVLIFLKIKICWWSRLCYTPATLIRATCMVSL